MKTHSFFAILFATLLFSCSKSEKTDFDETKISLQSDLGVSLANDMDDLKSQILGHLHVFEKDLNATLTDIKVTQVSYFKVIKGVSAKVNFKFKDSQRTIVLGKGNLPKFQGTIRGHFVENNSGIGLMSADDCVSYTTSCTGQSCCDVEGSMGRTGEMTFRCLCAGCTLNVTTKRFSC